MVRNRSEIATNTPTKFEVAVIRNSQVLEILGYTARKSKIGIYNLMANDLTRHFTEAEVSTDYTYSAKSGFTFGTDIRIGFTGRTEREVAV